MLCSSYPTSVLRKQLCDIARINLENARLAPACKFRSSLNSQFNLRARHSFPASGLPPQSDDSYLPFDRSSEHPISPSQRALHPTYGKNRPETDFRLTDLTEPVLESCGDLKEDFSPSGLGNWHNRGLDSSSGEDTQISASRKTLLPNLERATSTKSDRQVFEAHGENRGVNLTKSTIPRRTVAVSQPRNALSRGRRIEDSRNIKDSVVESSRDHSQREPWQLQKNALTEKFKDEGWKPRKRLSPDALEGIRALHTQYPEKYTTPILADQFKVSPEAIRRILKSKWRPNEEEEEDRRKRWDKRGEGIWSQMVELGIKPPKKWREMGVGKSMGSQPMRRKPTVNAPTIDSVDTETRNITDKSPISTRKGRDFENMFLSHKMI